MNKKKPLITFLDIETAPILANVWGMWQQNVGLNQIERDFSILSFSYKHKDSDEVFYYDVRNKKNINDDYQLLKKLWKILDKSDIVVWHNGQKFDNKKINARLLLNGFKPPSSFISFDTLLEARKKFGFTSNKLEYLTSKLCKKYKKMTHGKFPGFSLWEQCIKGNIEAWNEMEVYNKYDVLSLEELYDIIVPWSNKINFSVFNSGENICSCGSTNFIKNGFTYTKTGKNQRYKCLDCGSEKKSNKNLINKNIKKKMLR